MVHSFTNHKTLDVEELFILATSMPNVGFIASIHCFLAVYDLLCIVH